MRKKIRTMQKVTIKRMIKTIKMTTKMTKMMKRK